MTTQSLKQRPTLRSAVVMALIFAAVKLAIQMVGTHLALRSVYGIFRDELYYIMCGPIYLCRGPKFNFVADWPKRKQYI